jgi:hypothetical protein
LGGREAALDFDLGRLWSLLEMTNNFFFEPVRHLLHELDISIQISKRNMELWAALGGENSQTEESVPKEKDAKRQSIRAVDWCVKASERFLSPLKCPHIDDATKRLKRWLDDPSQWSELNTRARALRDAIDTELNLYFYYQYPRLKGEKLRSCSDEWKAITTAFPDVAEEAFSATDCYALGQNTAAVFHSMRVAEHGLRALAKEREITLRNDKPVEWATWQEIIRGLDAQITIIGNKKPGEARDAALAFYSGARADLNGLKDEYRNLCFHVRAKYDELQALRALQKVHEFMGRLSGKMDTRHRKIEWGTM